MQYIKTPVILALLFGFHIPLAIASVCEVPSAFATIQLAVNNLACTEIEVGAGVHTAAVTVNRDLTIRGADRDATSIQNTITINTDAVLVLEHLTIENVAGDAILLDSPQAELIGDKFDIHFSSNGIVHGPTGTDTPVDISNCEITDNQIGIDVRGLLTIDNCMVRFNTPKGGIRVLGKADITNSVISDNVNLAFGDGGGILFDHNGGTLSTIQDSSIVRNSAIGSLPATNTSDGGGIMVRSGQLTVERCDISGNVAGRHGGGIANSDTFGSPMTIVDSTINGNLAYSGGGGIAVGYRASVSNTLIENNLAWINSGINSNGLAVGGGIYVFQDELTLSDSTVRNNSVKTESGITSINSGGGVYINTDQPVIIERSTINANSAEIDGGGLSIGSTTTINNTTIVDNRADRDGGGIHGSSGAVISQSTITGNTADDDNNGVGDGGGISGSAQLNFTLIGNNNDKSVTPAYNPDCSGSIVSTGYSLLRINKGCEASFSAATGNQMGTDLSPFELSLEPLADNGGPTLTVALGQLSPALDAGSTGCGSVAAIDQRGLTRNLQDGNNDGGVDSDPCDIGAFETFASGCASGPVGLSSYTYVDMQTIQSEATISTNGDVIIAGTADVLLEANDGISIGPGFIAQVGSIFEARVIPVSCP